MSDSTTIGRRVEHSVEAWREKDYETVLLHLYPAIDNTSSKRRPNENRVGKKIRSFLEEEEKLISFIGTGMMISKIQIGNDSITDILYKFGRNTISHKGEIDSRIEFVETGTIAMGGGKWIFPSGYMYGMLIATILSPENSLEKAPNLDIQFNICGRDWLLRDLWGQRNKITKWIADDLQQPSILA